MSIHLEMWWEKRAKKRVPWGSDFGQIFTDCFYNSSTKNPKTHTYANTTIKQDPARRFRFVHNFSILVNQVQADQWTNGVRDIIATVSKRAKYGGENLQEREEFGCFGRIDQGELVHVDSFLLFVGQFAYVLFDIRVDFEYLNESIIEAKRKTFQGLFSSVYVICSIFSPLLRHWLLERLERN